MRTHVTLRRSMSPSAKPSAMIHKLFERKMQTEMCLLAIDCIFRYSMDVSKHLFTSHLIALKATLTEPDRKSIYEAVIFQYTAINNAKRMFRFIYTHV